MRPGAVLNVDVVVGNGLGIAGRYYHTLYNKGIGNGHDRVLRSGSHLAEVADGDGVSGIGLALLACLEHSHAGELLSVSPEIHDNRTVVGDLISIADIGLCRNCN